jgi:hypothetical protein
MEADAGNRAGEKSGRLNLVREQTFPSWALLHCNLPFVAIYATSSKFGLIVQGVDGKGKGILIVCLESLDVSALHLKRAAFLRSLIGTGIMAHSKARTLLALRQRVELSISQEDELEHATKDVEYVNRTLRHLGELGLDCQLKDLAKANWPTEAITVKIVLRILKIHSRSDYGAESYDFNRLDLHGINLNTVNVRTFDLSTFRI